MELENLTKKKKLKVAIIYDLSDLILSKVVLAIVVGIMVTSFGIGLPIALFFAMIIFFIYDLLGIYLATKMYGGLGWLQSWEIFDPTEIVAGFIPTLTITHFMVNKKQKIKQESNSYITNYCKAHPEDEKCLKK